MNIDIKICKTKSEVIKMSEQNKKKSTKNNKKEDGKFHSKHINHNPQAESARVKFGVDDKSFEQ